LILATESKKYQWLQWRETSSVPDSDSGRTSAAQHVGGVGHYPRAEISKFHIARYQFAELKIKLAIFEYHIYNNLILFPLILFPLVAEN